MAYLLVAYLSDHQQKRGLYTILFACVSMIGYRVLLAPVSSGAHYFGCFLVAIGLYVAVGIPLAWLPSNSPRYGKRVSATGIQLTCGNAAGIMSPFIYLNDDAPRFIKGHSVSLVMVGMGALIYLVLCWNYNDINRRCRNGEEDWKIINIEDDEINEMGDESPRYMYTI